MKKQTAVEFLFKQIYGDTGHIGSFTTEGKDAYEAFQRAIEMEREQIENAFNVEKIKWVTKIHEDGKVSLSNEIAYPNGDAYYNETYKQGEQ